MIRALSEFMMATSSISVGGRPFISVKLLMTASSIAFWSSLRSSSSLSSSLLSPSSSSSSASALAAAAPSSPDSAFAAWLFFIAS